MDFLVLVITSLQIMCCIGSKIRYYQLNTTECSSVTLISDNVADSFLKSKTETDFQYLSYKWRRIDDANVQEKSYFLQLSCDKRLQKQIISIRETHSQIEYLQRPVRISVLHFPPNVILPPKNKGSTMGGYFGEILNIFHTKLNTSFEIIRCQDGHFGTLINGSWAGMMGDLTRGKADIAPLFLTRQRSDYVMFSPQFFPLKTDLLFRKLDQLEPNYSFFLKPCNMETWLCILAISLIVILVNVFANHVLTQTNFASCFINELLHCWPIVLQGNLTSYSFKSMQLLFLIYVVFSMLLWVSYTSFLTSILATIQTKIPFTSLEDMLDNTDYLPVIVTGNTAAEIFQKPPYENTRVLQVRGVIKGIEIVFSGKFAFLCSFRLARNVIGKNCNLTTIPHYVNKQAMSFAYSKEFAHVDYFNCKILLLKEYGILSFEYNRCFPELEICLGNPFNPISFGQIIGPAVLILVGILFSIVIGLLELILYKFIT